MWATNGIEAVNLLSGDRFGNQTDKIFFAIDFGGFVCTDRVSILLGDGFVARQRGI